MQNLKMCRLCMTQPIVSHSLLESNGANILESLTSIKICKEDTLPKRACVKCWLNLKLAFQIQQSIIECDKKLRLFDVEQEPDNVDPLPEVDDMIQNIKEEKLELVYKMEPEDDSDYVDSEIDNPEINSIKVENHTRTELLIICPVGAGNSNENIVPFENEKTEKTFTTCHICGAHTEEDLLLDHLKTHYSTRLKCDECNTYCENIPSYRKHVLSNHKDMQESWTCGVCAARFQYKPLYIIHAEQAHPKETTAPRSRKALFSKSILQDYKYDCPYCNRKFKTEQASLSHIKTHNKKECPVCGVKITPSNFKVHVDSHTSPPMVCHLCGITYKNLTSLRSHIYYTHSTRKYACKYCDKVFKKAYDLPLHVKKEHTGQRDHTCDICGKSFYAFHNLNKHKKTTHMKLRPFLCQYCKKSFSSKHALRTHERQHTNITPYTCTICGEGFRQNVSLRSHKKSKHNIVEVKTFPCSVCGKKFGSKWAVLSHMRVH
ncbi:zinc finger protein 567-like [Anoplophora glabripennis]|uniref:zinc finger protein 567-like n=1 Tax=Anoplophora glabripennis TaxID=217634 RepID=UPI0008758C2A|nr:zinc finger protein 567-like [Anoplophora glabripennis]